MGKQANIIPPLQIIRNNPLEQLPINYICRFSIIATNFFSSENQLTGFLLRLTLLCQHSKQSTPLYIIFL